MSEEKKLNESMICQALTRKGAPCGNRRAWSVPISTQAEVERAVASGFPAMYPGMQEPRTTSVLTLCRVHFPVYLREKDSESGFRYQGGTIKTVRMGDVNSALGDPWKKIHEDWIAKEGVR